MSNPSSVLSFAILAALPALSGAVAEQPRPQGGARPGGHGGALDDVQWLQQFDLRGFGIGRGVRQRTNLVVGGTAQEGTAGKGPAAPGGGRAADEDGAEEAELRLGLGRSGAGRAAGQGAGSGSGGAEREDTVRLEVSRKAAQRMALGFLATCIMVATVPLLRAQGVVSFVALLVYLAGMMVVKLCVREVFDFGYPYPYATTAFQMAVTGLVASCIEQPTVSGAKSSLNIAMLKSASLALSSMALSASTPAVVSLVGALLPAATHGVELLRRRGEATAPRALGVLASCAGAMLCVRGELSCTPCALLLVLGGCLCRSLKTVWSHDFMQEEGQSPFRLAAWTAVWCLAVVVPVAQVREGVEPLVALCGLTARAKVVVLVGGALSAGVNILMCCVLDLLGPLCHSVYGQLELVLAFALPVSGLLEDGCVVQWMGVILICLSCVLTQPAAPSSTKGLRSDRGLPGHAQIST